MDLLVRMRLVASLSSLALGWLVPTSPAAAAEAIDWLRPPAAHASLDAIRATPGSAQATTTISDPVCDVYANGFDATGAGPCASCFDATTNFDESDVDCGGAYCKSCAAGSQCILDGDCSTGACSSGVCIEKLLISQVQTRGSNGGNDEFVEIYNPASVPISFDETWELQVRSAVGTCTNDTQATRFSGAGQVVPAHGYILFANDLVPGYDAAVAADGTYMNGITDAASVVLQHGAAVIDALCFYFDVSTQTNLTSCPTAYTCEGAPISNLPHNNGSSGSSNTDVAIERKPGGAAGNGQDTGDNLSDFVNGTPSHPRNTSSTPVP